MASKRRVIGMLAHVDAGKTTLSEAILYQSGTIRKLGRVDNRDAFFDTGDMERQRGITIFSKQAELKYKENEYTILDTPGHVDFSAETERTLWVLDMAILVISGADGVQGHTETLWSLLKRLRVPVFIFVNKMDQSGTNKASVLEQLKNKLSDACMDFANLDLEEAAMCDEAALNHYLDSGEVLPETIASMISERKIFPVYFGSALKLTGVDELLEAIDFYSQMDSFKSRDDEASISKRDDEASNFSAKIYKITRDEKGERITHMKVCSGTLKSKMLIGEEKVNQIRIYSGEKYSAVNEAGPGTICAVTGLTETKAGQYVGKEDEDNATILEPVLNYKVNLPSEVDPMQMLPKLRALEEEEPELRVTWDENFKEIHVSVMGPVLIEVLTSIIKERFKVDVTFSEGSIVYKETIRTKSHGVGHFEPLRHYAEVHLLLEPLEAGSGMKYATDCSVDQLDKNWQRLIYTHLCERNHRGVLTGATITDMKITLVAGRAHNKHTEGGDFRQATYRAIRQGLMEAESVLLEPFYAFTLVINRSYVGRAMTDLEMMKATFSLDESTDEVTVINGEAPVVVIGNYQAEVNAYTKGTGRLQLRMAGYRPCHNASEVIEAKGYDPERDTRNPVDSVFCAGGSGYVVPWNEVKNHAHVECVIEGVDSDALIGSEKKINMSAKQSARTVSDEFIGTDEVDRILAATYFANSKKDNERSKLSRRKPVNEGKQYVSVENVDNTKEVFIKNSVKNKEQDNSFGLNKSDKKDAGVKNYLLVDGYNIIHAWDELNELAKTNLDGARGRLQDILCNYQAMKGCELIIVYDAYRVLGHAEEFLDFHNIHIVFTKTAETADHYIEKFAHENGRKYNVTVATSDGLEQIIIRGAGCLLYSARDFLEEVRRMEEHIREDYLNKHF